MGSVTRIYSGPLIAILMNEGITVHNYRVVEDSISIINLGNHEDAWKGAKALVDGFLLKTAHMYWMTVEAYDDPQSGGMWRIIIGYERRAGRPTGHFQERRPFMGGLKVTSDTKE